MGTRLSLNLTASSGGTPSAFCAFLKIATEPSCLFNQRICFARSSETSIRIPLYVRIDRAFLTSPTVDTQEGGTGGLS